MLAAVLVGVMGFYGVRFTPAPPYVREASEVVFRIPQQPDYRVSGSVLYTINRNSCVAYSLPSLKRLWASDIPKGEWAKYLEVADGAVYVTTSPEYRKISSHLFCFDARTGKRKWELERTGPASAIAVNAGLAYVSLKSNTVSAVNLSNRKVRWTCRVGNVKGAPPYNGLETILFQHGTVVVNNAAVTYALDSRVGRIRWKQDKSYVFESKPLAAGDSVWVPSDEGSGIHVLVSGRLKWRLPNVGSGGFSAVVGDDFVVFSHETLSSISSKSGKVTWSHSLGSKTVSGGNRMGGIVGDLIFATGMDRSIICDRAGRQVWTGPNSHAISRPVWTDGKSIVAFDGLKLSRYRHGTSPALPTDQAARQALATKMTADFERLDAKDKSDLLKLGDDSFEALLKAFIVTCVDYDAIGDKGDSYPLYSKYHDIGELLTKVASAKRSADLISALQKLKPQSSATPLILTLVGQFGDPAVVTPMFLKELEDSATPGFEMYESNTYVARRYILGSKDPRAVEFLLNQLKNPKGDSTLREEAYWHLAGTGGKAGLDAVLAERNRRKQLRTLEERFLGDEDRKQIGLKKDASGRTWGLFRSGVLASEGDLWLAEQVDGNWIRPLFSGVSTNGVSSWVKPPIPDPKFAGKTAKELTDGAWFTVLVGSAELSQDTDGDGVTDIEERRLSTNPKAKDTDEDGMLDGVDPWPNAAFRALSDAEQVLAAAYEARYHFDDSEGPGVFSTEKGMKPFEFVGRRGPIVWAGFEQKPWSLPLQQCYGQGVALISFDQMVRDKNKPWEEQLIGWNREHTEAEVTISTYYDGLNGTGYVVHLRKFGNEWVAVRVSMAYIS